MADNEDEQPQKSSPDPGKNVKRESWLDDLARRSTGLPADTKPEAGVPKGDKPLWKMAGLGAQFALTCILFAVMGIGIDKKFGWSPWGLITMTLLAVVGNLYLLVKESLKEDGKPPSKK